MQAHLGGRVYQTIHWWHWLTNGNGFPNAAAVQAITGCVSAIAAIGAGIFAYRAYKATREQLIALREQTDSAKTQAAAAIEQLDLARKSADEHTLLTREQMKIATDAADSARRQGELLATQIEQSTAPLLVAEPDDRPGSGNYRLTNRGHGPAFQIMFWRGGFEERTKEPEIFAVQPSTLGPGVHTYLTNPPAWEIITVEYKGLDREPRWTVVHRDPRSPQQHLVRKGFTVVYLS